MSSRIHKHSKGSRWDYWVCAACDRQVHRFMTLFASRRKYCSDRCKELAAEARAEIKKAEKDRQAGKTLH